MHARVLCAFFVLLATAKVVQSRSWFAPEIGCWITQKKVPASWEDANRRCERHGAVLASPLNMQLLDYMQQLISVHNHSVAYFIGTRANRSEDEVHYVSVEGRRLVDMPRAVFDEIEQLDLDQGDCLFMDRHGIGAVSCWAHLPYICYSKETTECGSVPSTATISSTSVLPSSSTLPPSSMTTISGTSVLPSTSTLPPSSTTTVSSTSVLPSTSTLTPSSTSPPGYTYSSTTGSFYKFHKRTVSWFEANAVCTNEGAYLLVLNNALEIDVVRSIDGFYYGTWVGLRDSRPGGRSDWRTVHGEPVSNLFHQWYINRPLNYAEYTCAFYSDNYMSLYDVPCDYDQYFFTCERPL